MNENQPIIKQLKEVDDKAKEVGIFNIGGKILKFIFFIYSQTSFWIKPSHKGSSLFGIFLEIIFFDIKNEKNPHFIYRQTSLWGKVRNCGNLYFRGNLFYYIFVPMFCFNKDYHTNSDYNYFTDFLVYLKCKLFNFRISW